MRPLDASRAGLSHQLNLAILLGAAVVLVGVVAVRLSSRLGLPSLLVYLAIGLCSASPGSASASTTRS